MQVEQRLLKYVSYWTTSDENNMADGKIQIPSTERQFDLGKVLEQELRDLGLKNVVLTDHCYVYGLLPATAGCEDKGRWFLSHIWIPHRTTPAKTSNRRSFRIMTAGTSV